MTDVPFLLFCVLAWGQAARGRGAASGLAVAALGDHEIRRLLNLPLALLALPRPRRPGLILATIATVFFGAYCLWNLATEGALHVSAAGRLQQLGFDRQPVFAASFVASLGLAGLPRRWVSCGGRAASPCSPLRGPSVGAAATYGRGSVVIAAVAFGAARRCWGRPRRPRSAYAIPSSEPPSGRSRSTRASSCTSGPRATSCRCSFAPVAARAR
jgi:hypothetical protein